MKKYFVIGNPINHSLSPKLHNYWLKENNIDAIYDKIKLEDHEIKNLWDVESAILPDSLRANLTATTIKIE